MREATTLVCAFMLCSTGGGPCSEFQADFATFVRSFSSAFVLRLFVFVVALCSSMLLRSSMLHAALERWCSVFRIPRLEFQAGFRVGKVVRYRLT